MVDDERFEGTEYFNLRLDNPVMAVLEVSKVAKVTITDLEDGRI